MYKNYLAIALRNLWKQKSSSIINIFGLSVGLAASLLIFIYVQFELSYDKHNENLDRMYQISLHAALGGNEISAATSAFPMAAALRNEYAEVESATRINEYFQDTLVSLGEVSYQESGLFMVDPEFFDIFTVNFLSGDMETALNDPYTVVLTESTARKYFGNNSALGSILRFNNNQDYEVTGVISDFPANSHFHPDFLVSFTSHSNHDSQFWINNNINTYLLLRPGSSADLLEPKLQELVTKYIAPQIEEGIGASYADFLAGGGKWDFALFPVADIHLYSTLEGELEPPGNAVYVYTFQAVAFFILILACINFTNLSTARSANRAKEIGIRKVVGAQQDQLITQFLLESVLTSFFALLIAIPIVALLLPSLSGITDRELSLDFLFSLPSITLLLVGTLLVGVIAGTYPAFYLARFHPQQVLKGALGRGGGNYWIRSGLVILQFVISISLISATLIVFNQLEYVRTKDLGFDKEQLVVVERANALATQLESFKTQIAQSSGVINVTSSSHLPGQSGDQNSFQVEGRPASATEVLHRFTVSYDYIETLGIQLSQGRSFSRDISGGHPGYLINETAARELALEAPLSASLIEPVEDGTDTGPIIGVVKDFHFMSLHAPINPLVLRVDDFARYIIVRAEPGQLDSVIAALQSNWNETTNGEPFSYQLLGQRYDALHEGEERVGELFLGFSALAVSIACLGLYGLASFATSQRTKEIGIRKTLGAPVSNIVMMISKEFVLLVCVAILVAFPLAYVAMSRWLEVFAYRIDIGTSVFITSGLAAIVIAFLTVSIQSTVAANTNPSVCLRDE